MLGVTPMDMDQLTNSDPSNKPHSKLFVRSEVLAVIQQLNSQEEPSKADKTKYVKRLRQLDQPVYVQDILVNELKRSKQHPLLQLITELLMELGDGEYLHDILWDLIRDPAFSDDIKDAANLVLRHLGDTSDPELYLEYLQDPQGLIAQETTRMISASAENPETLIDFIDFIQSLNLEDQVRLVSSLHRDYGSQELVDMFVPLLESDPHPELWGILIDALGETRSPKAVRSLRWMQQWPADQKHVDPKRIDRALKTLQFGGALKQPMAEPEAVVIELSHAISSHSQPYKSFATIPDGIGNQGLLFSRQRQNSDVSLFCLAINDLHGIIDCFGFYQLSETDFHRIVEKFHEGASKIPVDPGYIVHKVIQAESMNRQCYSRLPYEYQCWRPLLGDIEPLSFIDIEQIKSQSNPDWFQETVNLYQHPDFNAWFLEQGDEPLATPYLQEAVTLIEDHLNEAPDSLTSLGEAFDKLADALMVSLLDSPWRSTMQLRLLESAYLLHCQSSKTFAALAATESAKLDMQAPAIEIVSGFIQAYGRRCVLEECLRYRIGHTEYAPLTALIEQLGERWGL